MHPELAFCTAPSTLDFDRKKEVLHRLQVDL